MELVQTAHLVEYQSDRVSQGARTLEEPLNHQIKHGQEAQAHVAEVDGQTLVGLRALPLLFGEHVLGREPLRERLVKRQVLLVPAGGGGGAPGSAGVGRRGGGQWKSWVFCLLI